MFPALICITSFPVLMRNNTDKEIMIIKIIFTWVMFIPVAIANGIIREYIYKPIVGDLPAHQISTFIAITAFITMVYFLRKNDFRFLKTSSLLLIGFVWMILTILFEFGFGHFIDNISWSRLLSDYDLSQGRVWMFMLLAELFTPLIVRRITNLRR